MISKVLDAERICFYPQASKFNEYQRDVLIFEIDLERNA